MQGFPSRRVYTMMAKRIIWFILGVLLAAGCTHMSLDKTSPDGMANAAIDEYTLVDEYDAIVTVKQRDDETVYFQVDSATFVEPMFDYEYQGPERLACHLKLYVPRDRTTPLPKGWWLGKVTWMEKLEKGKTEMPAFGGNVKDEADGKDGADGGTSPTNDPRTYGLEVLNDWLTTVQDGFFTLHYSAWWGDGSVPHNVVLLPGKTPFELNLRHFSNGDIPQKQADALIYFDLQDLLPQTEGHELSINWFTCDGKTAQKTYWYRSRTE